MKRTDAFLAAIFMLIVAYNPIPEHTAGKVLVIMAIVTANIAVWRGE